MAIEQLPAVKGPALRLLRPAPGIPGGGAGPAGGHRLRHRPGHLRRAALLRAGRRLHPDGFNEEVDRLRHILTGGKGIIAEMEAKEKERTGIRTLKIGYNKVFGYYIEVSKSFAGPGARYLHPQADPGERGAVHHPGAQGPGKLHPHRLGPGGGPGV